VKRYVKVLLVVIAVLAIAAFPVLAQSQQPPDQSVIDLLVELLTGLGIPISLPGLAAIAAFFNIVVNVLKQVKIDGNPLIPDDWGGFVVLAAEVAAVAVAAIAGD
jgi:O-antigen/teichoic acid export membrane protein